MILTDPCLHSQFTDYGILIPIRTSKITRVLDHLEALESLKGKQWKVDHITETAGRDSLARVHDEAYLDKLYGPGLEREILSAYELMGPDGKPNRYAPETATKALARFFEDVVMTHVAGTTQACRMALETGWAFFTGGGLHHGHLDRGSGFCLVNDLVAAVRTLQAEGQIQRAWIVDVDAHKGDGTAAVAAGDDTVLTFSIHMARGWPLDEATAAMRGSDNPSLTPSDIDVGQEPGEDHLYLPRLAAGLEQLKALSLAKHGRLADLVLVVDGADPYEMDELPSTATMRLTLEQMLERDLMLDKFFTDNKIPSAWVNAGGYGDHVWKVYAQFLERVLPSKLTQH